MSGRGEANVSALSDRRSQLTGLIKWAGGKSALSKILIPVIRSRRPKRIVEPFAGSAALALRLGLPNAILGDVNEHLMRFHLAVKSNPRRLAKALDEIAEASRGLSGTMFDAFYYQVREQFPLRSLYQNAATFVFLNRHCWNGLYRENAAGKFNTPIGSHHSLQPLPTIEQLLKASKALAQAQLVTGDFTKTVEFAQPGDFVYLDPPYIPISSTAGFSKYQGQSFTWRDHIRLKRALYVLQERRIDFALSNSFQKLTVALYSDFSQHILSASGNINSRGSLRQPRKEILVTNFSTKLLRDQAIA